MDINDDISSLSGSLVYDDNENELDQSNLSQYELNRHKLRYGNLQTSLLIFKTTVGLGLFSYQYSFGLVRAFANKY